MYVALALVVLAPLLVEEVACLGSVGDEAAAGGRRAHLAGVFLLAEEAHYHVCAATTAAGAFVH